MNTFFSGSFRIDLSAKHEEDTQELSGRSLESNFGWAGGVHIVTPRSRIKSTNVIIIFSETPNFAKYAEAKNAKKI